MGRGSEIRQTGLGLGWVGQGTQERMPCTVGNGNTGELCRGVLAFGNRGSESAVGEDGGVQIF